MMHEAYISVDIESSGPIPGEYSMLSIGACDAYAPELSFSCLIRPVGLKCDPDALAVSGLSLDVLADQGLPPEEAMGRFDTWVKATCVDRRPVFVGLNAGFDWSFVNYYFIRFHGSNPFGFSALDIKAMYMGARRCNWRATTSTNMKRTLGASLSGTHDALEDARFQAELFRLIRG